MDRNALIEAMRATAQARPVAVEVPAWGVVYVRPITVAEVDEQTADAADGVGKSKLARGACRVLCDENGARLFDPNSAADVDLLAAQPWQLLRRVLAASDPTGASGKD